MLIPFKTQVQSTRYRLLTNKGGTLDGPLVILDPAGLTTQTVTGLDSARGGDGNLYLNKENNGEVRVNGDNRMLDMRDFTTSLVWQPLGRTLPAITDSLELVNAEYIYRYYAPIDSPALTGIPTSTKALTTGTPQIATGEFIEEFYYTKDESDTNYVATVDGIMKGAPILDETLVAPIDDKRQIPNIRYIENQYYNREDTNRIFAPIDSPNFTGRPMAPTPDKNDEQFSTSQIPNINYIDGNYLSKFGDVGYGHYTFSEITNPDPSAYGSPIDMTNTSAVNWTGDGKIFTHTPGYGNSLDFKYAEPLTINTPYQLMVTITNATAGGVRMAHSNENGDRAFFIRDFTRTLNNTYAGTYPDDLYSGQPTFTNLHIYPDVDFDGTITIAAIYPIVNLGTYEYVMRDTTLTYDETDWRFEPPGVNYNYGEYITSNINSSPISIQGDFEADKEHKIFLNVIFGQVYFGNTPTDKGQLIPNNNINLRTPTPVVPNNNYTYINIWPTSDGGLVMDFGDMGVGLGRVAVHYTSSDVRVDSHVRFEGVVDIAKYDRTDPSNPIVINANKNVVTDENGYLVTRDGGGGSGGYTIDVDVTIPSADWIDNTSNWSALVAVPGMVESDSPIIGVNTAGITDLNTINTYKEALSSIVYNISGLGEMTLYASAQILVDLPITVKLFNRTEGDEPISLGFMKQEVYDPQEKNEDIFAYVDTGDATKISKTGDGTLSGQFAPATDSTGTIGSSTKRWSGIYASNFYGNITGNVTGTASGNIPRTGAIDLSGNFAPTSNGTGSLGLTNQRWGTIYGNTISAASFVGNLNGNATTASNATTTMQSTFTYGPNYEAPPGNTPQIFKDAAGIVHLNCALQRKTGNITIGDVLLTVPTNFRVTWAISLGTGAIYGGGSVPLDLGSNGQVIAAGSGGTYDNILYVNCSYLANTLA